MSDTKGVTRRSSEPPPFRWLGLIACSLAFSGCISDRAFKDFGTSLEEGLAAPFNAIARSRKEAQELAYATAAFQRRNGRWPKDYGELSVFVAQTDGLLFLSDYERVDLLELAEDRLEVVFVPHGQTNELCFTFSPSDVKAR